MANKFNQRPMVLDTDFSSYRAASGSSTGIRVEKFTLSVGQSAASSAGNVSITSPDGIQLYPILPIPAGDAANTIQVFENPNPWTDVFTWRDFGVTGLTATGTVLYIWWKD